MKIRFGRARKRSLSKESQAVEYGRSMGIESVVRQWCGSDSMRYSVMRRLEQIRPVRVGLVRPVARRA